MSDIGSLTNIEFLIPHANANLLTHSFTDGEVTTLQMSIV